MSDDLLYLVHILECISKVKSYNKKGKKNFFSDLKTQDATIRNLQILSESTQRLSKTLQTKYSEINWSQISGFRNVLTHGYLGINLDRVWEILQEKIPALQKTILKILNDLGEDPKKLVKKKL